MWHVGWQPCERSLEMPDVHSLLDRRLRSFLDEIKAQPLPHQLADFKPATVRSGRKVLNVLAGTVAVAVIAATATVFAIELNGHHGPGSPVPGDKAGPTSTPKPTPSSPAASSLPTGAKVLIPPTSGTGTETLPTVTLGPNEGIWIAYGCSSNDHAFQFHLRFRTWRPCVPGTKHPVVAAPVLNAEPLQRYVCRRTADRAAH